MKNFGSESKILQLLIDLDFPEPRVLFLDIRNAYPSNRRARKHDDGEGDDDPSQLLGTMVPSSSTCI